MKNVLMIAYFFPPLGGPGVQRVQKFVKYLPLYDWNPTVLTVKPIEYIAYDKTLLEEIGDVAVHRTGSFDLMRLLYIFEKIRANGLKKKKIYTSIRGRTRKYFGDVFPIDSKIGWLPFAYSKGKKILKAKNINAIYATIGPFTSAIAAYNLAKKFKLPLIVDYRDLWTGKPDITYFSKWHKKFSIDWERRILQFANTVIINTDFSRKKIQTLFPEIQTSKFKVIYNGWDKTDFPNIKREDERKIIFSYTGGFYGERTPYFFLDVLKELLKKKLLPDNIEFRFIGNYFKDIEKMLKDNRLRKVIKIVTQVSHQESIVHLLQSDFLLLFIAKRKSEIVLPAKIFEYLAAKKPILAMIPEKGEAAKLIKENNAGLISEIDDEKAIMQNILKMIDLHKSNKAESFFDLNLNDYNKYERKHLTKQLSNILNETSV